MRVDVLLNCAYHIKPYIIAYLVADKPIFIPGLVLPHIDMAGVRLCMS